MSVSTLPKPDANYDADADEKHAPGHHDSLDVGSDQARAETDALEKQFAANSAPEETYGKSASSNELKAGEEHAADDTVGGGFNSDEADDDSGSKKKKKRFWTKKKVAAGGGITGAVVGGGLFGLSFLSGPLQFIHIAEVLHNSHFSQQEDAGDSRMGKMFRYLRNGKSAGATRLSWLGNKYHGKIIGDLNSIGINPDYGSLDSYKGFTVDTKHENSPYKDMSIEDAAKVFEEKTGIKPTIVGKTLKVDSKGFWGNRAALKASLSDLKLSGVTVAVRTRILGKFGMVSWHPLSRITGAADVKVADLTKDKIKKYKEKWDTRYKTGTAPATVDGTGAKDETETTDKDGNKVTTTTAATADEQAAISNAPKNAGATLKGLKVSGSIAGGAAAAAGLACALKAIDDGIGAIAYTQVILPMIRVGADAITVGNQIKSGQDVDPDELGYLSKYFSSVDSATGKTNSWTDSAPIKADMGGTGGIDMASGIKDTVQEQKPAWLSWTQSGAMSGLCSTAGQVITGIVGAVVGLISGPVSFITGSLISMIAAGPIMTFVTNILSGDALNITNMAGANYGNIADYGATMAANAASVVMGGTELSQGAISQLNTQVAEEQRSDFDSQSFLKRTFDTSNYQSLASVVLADQTTSFSRNLMSGVGSVMGTFGSVLRMPLSLYGSTVHAATPGYQYPFKIYGYSQADLNNTSVEDPFQNADDVATILDNNNQAGTPDYIKKASDCFGVNITKDNSDSVWDVIPAHDINIYDPENYHPGDCADTNDPTWLKVRMFILDTSVMEGYTCAQFQDADSCATNNGGTAPAPTTDATGTVPDTADIATLAKAVLDNPNITFKGGNGSQKDIEDTAAGKKVTPGPIGTGASGLPGCSARTPTSLNPALLKVMLAIAQKYQYQINGIISGHDCDTGQHTLGKAMDVFYIAGKPLNDGWWSSSANIGTVNGIADIVNSTGDFQHGFGVGCSAVSKITSRKNLDIFNDSCGPQDEIHIDVRGAP